MKIEVEKFYKTRDGRKAYCHTINSVGKLAHYTTEELECGVVFSDTGSGYTPHEYELGHVPEHENDLVAEWTDEPTTTNPFLKTVTETRVVGGFHRFESSHAVVEIKENRNGEVYIQTEHYYDKQSIAELARILAEISEAMA